MNQQELISSTRIELQDLTPASYVVTDDIIIRGMEKTINLMSRFIPKRTVVEYDIVRTINSESLVISDSTGTLAYKPIKDETLKITGKTEDTDFTVNNLTGVVSEVGSLLADGTYIASYELEDNRLDLSELGLSEANMIRVESIEYPAQINPAERPTFEVVGNILTLRGSKTFSEGNRIRITYLEKWTPPTNTAIGNYPTHLDDIIIIGTVGQSLLYKSEKYTQEAYTAITASKTLLDAITAVTFTSAPDITSYINLVLAALAKGLAILDSIEAVTFTTAPDIAAYQTAATSALNDGNAALDAISAVSFTSAPDIATSLTEVKAPLTLAETRYAFAVTKAALEDVLVAAGTGLIPIAIAKMATETEAGKALITAGEAKFNIWTRGDRVGENYVAAANAEAALAQTYGVEANTNKELAQLHSQRAQVETNIGNGYVQSGSQRLGALSQEIQKYQSQVAQDSAKVNAYSASVSRVIAFVQEATQRLAGAGKDLEKFQLQVNQEGYKIANLEGLIKQANEYANEATQHIATMNAELSKFQLQVQQDNSKVTYYAAQLDKAGKYESTAKQLLEVAGRFLASGQAKVNEFLTALGIKPEYSSQKASSEQR